DTWVSWLTWLKAIYALPMDESEHAIYHQCTGRTQPPATQPSEIYTIVGRRGGKSFISSLTAVFIACFSSFKQYLNAGEKAAILDLDRVAVLRAGSDFLQPYDGQSSADNLVHYAAQGGFPIALENLYRAASPLVQQIVNNSPTWRRGVPAH